MTCAGTNTIAALLAGTVDAAVADRLELHLDRCRTCRELVANLGRGLSAIGAAPAPDRLPQPGEQIGRYAIRRVIGVGGMGVVYEAHDTMLDRRVAVKLLRPDLLEGASLLGEAQAMARLQHPNIVGVFDAGIAHGQLYLCMEYVAGTTLRAWAQQRTRTWRDVVRVYAAAGEGLAYVHRSGLVHLDFKPDNVLVDSEGRVRVTDFGLARMVDARPARHIVGTPAYMAPEQRRCEPTDARSDQYAFCASLHEALGDRSIPAWLRRVIARGMSVDRDRRFATMGDLLGVIADRLAQRRRRAGGVVVMAASAAAFALVMPRGAPARAVASRPIHIVSPALHLVNAPPGASTPDRAAPASSPIAQNATAVGTAPSYGRLGRRDLGPALVTIANLVSYAPRRVDALERAFTIEHADEGGDAGFTTELGPCDDGSLRTCSLAMPVCPADSVVAVQAGCWTCADTQTCMRLGLPRTCNDGSPLTCTRERPACEGRRVAAVRNGCWSCEDPFTCWSRSQPTKPPPRPPVCGNHKCERSETERSCATDCAYHGGSGGGSNTGSNAGSGSNGPTCGNGFCEIGEDHASCDADCCETDASGSCAAVCGNGFCESGEDHSTCASDCCEVGPSGACLPVCGNLFCEDGESAATCASDC